eukprot:CAMPEP_0184559116 /NCGR_PEP_ID=MMETSP0199_2-20130426/46267_1 /TAXON_ID=1112570 /ORGANISM="Thraustochytrium sp., Strain LLF1b" /LENGTH=172 /DNA_ID=CAMNT_0026956399 /DNA_START=188 /DNA_END=702 /DNA_ORIENTATION=+
MARKGSQTILLLGVSGLGLALAMFFDGVKARPVKDIVDDTANDIVDDTANDAANDTVNDAANDTVNDAANDTVNDAANDTVNDTADDTVNDTADDTVNNKRSKAGDPTTDQDSTLTGDLETLLRDSPGYKEYFRQKKRETEAPPVMTDNRYRGDGSGFSKKMYFMKEAYRRS